MRLIAADPHSGGSYRGYHWLLLAQVNGIASELNAALAEFRLSPATSDAGLSRILRELDNFPDPDHPAIPVVRRLISELRKVGLEVTDITIELAAAEKNLRDLEADFARDCIGR